MACCLARRPMRDQIDQHCVVRLLGLTWVGPVASPYHSFRRGFQVSRRYHIYLIVSGWWIVGGNRQLHPCPALVDELANHREGGMVYARRLGQMSHVIENNLGRQAVEQSLVCDDLVAVHVEIDVPA